MPSTDLHYLTIDEASKLIHDRELSSVELTQAHIDRIDVLNDTLHAFLTPTPRLALQQAENADREIAAGNSRGPLHGIPIALKDLCDTKGIRTTYGSLGFNDRVPDSDATVTERLREAGTTMLGKLTMSELGNDGPAQQRPRGPEPLEHRSRPRRFQQRIGRRSFRRPLLRRPRLRHRRLHPISRFLERHIRHPALEWKGQQSRSHALKLDHG